MKSPQMVGLVLILAGVLLLALGGCTNTYASLKQSVIATDGAVVTTTTLKATHLITAEDCRAVSAGAKGLLAAESTWKAALDAGDTDAGKTAAAAVQAALTRLSAELLAMQQNRQLKLDPAAGRMRLATSGKKSLGEVTAAIAIINLVADLTPALVNWINASTASANVTGADVQAAIDTLTRDIAALDVAGAAAGAGG